MSELILNRKTRKVRSLTKEHREKISLAHKGKKKNHSFANRKITIINPIWFFKPVVCINTGKRFTSLAEAAEKVYKNKLSYIYISQVCQGIKSHYKKLLWLYESDYILLSESEKHALKNKCIELPNPTIKYKTKPFFNNIVYNSFSELGVILFKEGLLSYRTNTREDLSKVLSTMVGVAKRKQCPFIILKGQYIFFADYEVFYKSPKSTIKVGEKPINKTVEEVYDDYIQILHKPIGDITILDLLQSSKNAFYKLHNMYFKNESNIKPYAYDKTIDKATVLSLIDDKNYKLLFNTSNYNLCNASKNKFYVKNNYIFLNRDDYINRFIRILTREEVLEELNLIYYSHD